MIRKIRYSMYALKKIVYNIKDCSRNDSLPLSKDPIHLCKSPNTGFANDEFIPLRRISS